MGLRLRAGAFSFCRRGGTPDRMWIRKSLRPSVGLAAVLFLAAPLSAARNRAAASPPCPQSPPVPPVSLDYAEDLLATDNRHSMSELMRMVGRAEHPLGLYRGRMVWRMEVAYEGRRQGQEVCVWIRQVTLHLRLEVPRISIARELDTDSCK